MFERMRGEKEEKELVWWWWWTVSGDLYTKGFNGIWNDVDSFTLAGLELRGRASCARSEWWRVEGHLEIGYMRRFELKDMCNVS